MQAMLVARDASLANRLTEDPATSVLVLEAGGDYDVPAINMPVAYPSLFGTPMDWAGGAEGGATATFCPILSAPRPTAASARRSTAPTVRCTSRTPRTGTS